MSNRIVKGIRYALLLPLLHLLTVAAPMFHRAETLCHYIPTVQRSEDYEKDHPPSKALDVYYWPCYEYRMSTADRVMFAAEFPAAALVGFDQECLPAAVRSVLYRLMKYRVRVATRVVLIDFLFLAGVFAQWFLVGRWVDLLIKRSMMTSWWIILVAVISGGGIVMIPGVFHNDGLVEHVNILAGMAALLAWLALLVTFAIVGIKKGWAVVRAPRGPRR
ncbi:MAG: hypothetical protein WB683_12010 [Candidatus Sulfotelmatobacter sp.]